MIRPRRRITLRSKVIRDDGAINAIEPTKDESKALNCNSCGVELRDMLEFCRRINGFGQKFLCTQCGNDMEQRCADSLLGVIPPTLSDVENHQAETETDDDAAPSHQLTIELLGSKSDPKDGDDVQCRICPRTFASTAARNHHHSASHRNARTGAFRCPYCALEMKQISNLQVHVMRHTGRLPCVCAICGKGFPHAAFLQKHMRAHSGARDFVCATCDKGFKYKHGLVQHQLRHTNARPFACDQCAKTYRDLSDLRRHKYTHGGVAKRFECAVCAKQFFDQKWLRQHMRIHVGNS